GEAWGPRRNQAEGGGSSTESRNGQRQPQAGNAAAPRPARRPPTTSSASSSPSVAVVWIQLVQKPRRPGGACSATYVAAPPYSPPSASPCSTRSSTSRMGAAAPMLLYVGSTPTSAVAAPIPTIVHRNVYLRPTRSPSRPNTRAPNGRTANPTPNSARLDRNAIVGSPAGKNRSPIVSARMP